MIDRILDLFDEQLDQDAEYRRIYALADRADGSW